MPFRYSGSCLLRFCEGMVTLADHITNEMAPSDSLFVLCIVVRLKGQVAGDDPLFLADTRA